MKLGNKIKVTVMVDPKDVGSIDEIAEKDRSTRSKIVRNAIRDYILDKKEATK